MTSSDNRDWIENMSEALQRLLNQVREEEKSHYIEETKTAVKEERERILEVIDQICDENDDGLWWGRKILDDLKAKIDIESES